MRVMEASIQDLRERRMRVLAMVWAALAVVGAAAVIVFANIGVMPVGLGLPWILFLDADPIAKLVMLMLAMTLATVIVMAGTQALKRSGSPSEFLRIAGLVAPGLGLLGSLYVGINIGIAAAALKPPLPVMAPGLAELCQTAAMGFAVGAVALWLSEVLSRRAAVT
jgi:hypothetical protein